MNLTDEDVERIAEALETRLVNRFYLNLGKGLWAKAWQFIVVAIVAISAYGAFKGMK